MLLPACSPAIDVWTREVWDKSKRIKKKKKSMYKSVKNMASFGLGKKKKTA